MSNNKGVDKKAEKIRHKQEMADMEEARKKEKKYLKTLSKKDKRAYYIDKQSKIDAINAKEDALLIANGGKARRRKKTTKKNGMPK